MRASSSSSLLFVHVLLAGGGGCGTIVQAFSTTTRSPTTSAVPMIRTARRKHHGMDSSTLFLVRQERLHHHDVDRVRRKELTSTHRPTRRRSRSSSPFVSHIFTSPSTTRISRRLTLLSSSTSSDAGVSSTAAHHLSTTNSTPTTDRPTPPSSTTGSTSATTTPSSLQSSSSSSLVSAAAAWHRQRRQAMLHQYKDQIVSLMQKSSLTIGLPLLLLVNFTLITVAVQAGQWSLPTVLLASIFPGSIASLWQLQLLHDVLHGCFTIKQQSSSSSSQAKQSRPNHHNTKRRQDRLLFWGSMPNYFGYYLYLQFGHLSHHQKVGHNQYSNLQTLFASNQTDFEDGDVLFVAHRMQLPNKIGPSFHNPFAKNETITFSLSRSAFEVWKPHQPYWNGLIFALSFALERFMLGINDIVVAIAGHNYFFPSKPVETFHQPCTTYARWAVMIRCLIFVASGCSYKSMLFLFLSEILWSIPPHPAAAMFVTNHPSSTPTSGSTTSNFVSMSGCIPTQSTYAGAWYSILTLGTNYHCEHHDFPTIPFHLLHQLHQIAPEFYPTSQQEPRRGTSKNNNVWSIMKQALAQPNVYACMNVLED